MLAAVRSPASSDSALIVWVQRGDRSECLHPEDFEESTGLMVGEERLSFERFGLRCNHPRG